VELARAVDADGMVGAVDAALPEHAATTSTSAAKRTAIGPRVARAGWTGTNTGEEPPRAGSAVGGAGRGTAGPGRTRPLASNGRRGGLGGGVHGAGDPSLVGFG